MKVETRLAARAVSERLQSHEALIVGALCLALAIAAARFEWAISPRGALDRTLLRDNLGWLLPLFGYFVFNRAFARGSLQRAWSPIARHGGKSSAAWVGLIAPPTAALVVAGALFAALGVVFAREAQANGFALELYRSVWIGSAAGLAYAAWFSLGSSLGRRGQGRLYLLLGDFLFGSGAGWLALPWPRAHIRNLLGGAPALEMDQAAAGLALLIGTVFALSSSRARIDA